MEAGFEEIRGGGVQGARFDRGAFDEGKYVISSKFAEFGQCGLTRRFQKRDRSGMVKIGSGGERRFDLGDLIREKGLKVLDKGTRARAYDGGELRQMWCTAVCQQF